MYVCQRKFISGYLASTALLFSALCVAADEQPVKNTIGPGKVVSLSYIVSLPDGEVVHSNVDSFPVKYKQGDGKLLPALEAALAGLKAGDQRSVTLPPESTYPINEKAFQEVPLDSIPEDKRKVGTVFRAMGGRGTVRVAEINENTALLDFNHPLAGKTLTYDVTILSVE
jgi:FKBP-type peptidyl-prolyl cis-trans isomerase 2